MGIGSRGSRATAIRRVLASAALFAQAILPIAPLVELHDHEAGSVLIAAGFASPTSSPLVAQAHRPGHWHDAATCPACIAQSLHAQSAPAAPVPAHAAVDRHVLDLHSAVVVSTGPPSAHHSRAPPTSC